MKENPDYLSSERTSVEAPPARRRKRKGGHGSTRAEFLALFRDTRQAPPGAPGSPDQAGTGGPGAPWGQAGAPPPGPSRFLRRFLQTAPVAAAAPSGLAGLDRRLGGGFGYGAHLVLGPPGPGPAAFLESVAWEAVAGHRPALYYAFRGGSLGVWERLIATLGTILEGPAITPAALRGQGLVDKDRDTLARLDAALQESVFPYLSLIDPTPACICSASTFIQDIRTRAQEAGEQYGLLPLVLVDDLERLTALTESESPLGLLFRLDGALAADSIPGLIAGCSETWPRAEAKQAAVHTLLTLAPELPTAAGTPERVVMEVQKNVATGWTGSLSLLLDPWSGLFAEPGTRG